MRTQIICCLLAISAAAGQNINGVPSQSVVSTGHQIISPLTCAAASASGTAYVCNTSPSFTPVVNDAVSFYADVPNSSTSASLTVNGVSGSMKLAGSTTLTSGELIAGYCNAWFDGTNWNVCSTGPPSGNAGGVLGAYTGTNSYPNPGSLRFQPAVTDSFIGMSSGASDNSAAMSALFTAMQTGSFSRNQWVPNGSYLFATPQALYGPNTQYWLEGMGSHQSVFQYNGATASPALTIAGDSMFTQYGSNDHFGDFGVIGNATNTYDLYLNQLGGTIENIHMWGGNASTGACLYSLGAVGTRFSRLSCTSESGPGSIPYDGLVMADSGPVVIDSPNVVGVNGAGIRFSKVTYGSSGVILGAQLAMNGIDLTSDAYSNNIISIGSLFEMSGTNPAIEMAGTGHYFLGSSAGNALNLGVSGACFACILQSGQIQRIHIGSGNHGTVVQNVALTPSNVIDDARDTEYHNNLDQSNNNEAVTNFPQHRTAYPLPDQTIAGVSNYDLATEIKGGYYINAANSSVAIYPTTLVQGKAWTAHIHGVGTSFGTPYNNNCPTDKWMTDSDNTWCGLTFSVNGSGKLQAFSSAGATGFAGKIDFEPLSNVAPGSFFGPSIETANAIKINGGGLIDSSAAIIGYNALNVSLGQLQVVTGSSSRPIAYFAENGSQTANDLTIINGSTVLGGFLAGGIPFGPALAPSIIYSAAGTSVPPCNAGTKGYEYTASDVTTLGSYIAYVSGGTFTGKVICNYNSATTTYSLLVH